MANSDKNIVITPNISSTTDYAKIVFSGADSSTSAQNITLRAYPTNGGTLSFEGSAGQLMSIANTMSGTIFSANDVSGIPSIEVLDTGLVKLAQYNGQVGISTSTAISGAKLTVTGGVYVNGVVTATTFVGAVTGAASQVNTAAQTANANYYPTFVSTNNASAAAMSVYTTSSFVINPATGNVGIGVTPAAWGAGWVVAQLGLGGAVVGRTANSSVYFTSNTYFDGTVYRYINTDFASYYRQFSGNHYFYSAPSGTASTTATMTSILELVQAGNLRIPTGQLEVSLLNNTSKGAVAPFLTDATNGGLIFKTESAGTLTERMRIDSTGTVTISATTTSTSTTTGALQVAGGVGVVGNLNVGGEIRANNEITAYYSSDIRLKENIRLISNPITIVGKLRGVYFDWTDAHIQKRGGEDGYFVRKHDIGVIAQEVEAVLPELVAERDDGTKVVKYEKLVALLIEAIKEQQLMIEELKSQIQELKIQNK